MPPGRSRKEIGEAGERLAEEFLRKLGYKLLRRNWRAPGGEIDLIARDGKEVVFAEVKSRSTGEWGDPETAVHRAKQRRICLAARQFANRYRLRGHTLRFDVVAVLLDGDRPPQIRHYKSAFVPPSLR